MDITKEPYARLFARLFQKEAKAYFGGLKVIVLHFLGVAAYLSILVFKPKLGNAGEEFGLAVAMTGALTFVVVVEAIYLVLYTQFRLFHAGRHGVKTYETVLDSLLKEEESYALLKKHVDRGVELCGPFPKLLKKDFHEWDEETKAMLKTHFSPQDRDGYDAAVKEGLVSSGILTPKSDSISHLLQYGPEDIAYVHRFQGRVSYLRTMMSHHHPRLYLTSHEAIWTLKDWKEDIQKYFA